MKPMTDGEASRQIQGAGSAQIVSEVMDDLLRRAGYDDTANALSGWIVDAETEIDNPGQEFYCVSAIEKILDGFDPVNPPDKEKLLQIVTQIDEAVSDYMS